MGNSQAGANVAVQLNQTVFVPGSMLVGKVYVSVTDEAVEAKTLDVTISGCEHTSVVYHTGSGKHRRRHVATQSSVFLSATLPLAQMPQGKMSKGSYEFPFQFQLPIGLFSTIPNTPGSASDNRFSISYNASAVLHSGQTAGFFNSSEKVFSGTSQFVVYSGVSSIPVIPKYIDPSFYPVTTCCCINDGMVAMGMNLSTSSLTPGAPLTISFYLQNNSTEEIKSIQFLLEQQCSWHAGSHHSSYNMTMQQVNFDASPQKNQTGLDSNLLVSHKEPIAQDSNDLIKIKNYLDSGKATLQLTFPANQTLPSFIGKLSRVAHKVIMIVEFGCCVSNIRLEAEVNIVNKLQVTQSEEPTIYPESITQMGQVFQQQQQQIQSMLPQNWNPNTAQMQSIPQAQRVDQAGQGPNVPQQNLGPAEMLVSRLSTTFTPSTELQQYIAAYGHAHPNLGLTDAQFTAVFHAIPLSYNQIDAASVIGSSLSSISCATLAAIADGCQEYNKADVLGQLLQKTAVSDKQNKVLVEKKLTQFQFMNLDSKFFQ